MLMNNMNFVKGMGVGLMVGSAIGMAVAAPKKNGKKIVGRALKTIGEVVEDVTDAMMR
jgi:gas vesicle protein